MVRFKKQFKYKETLYTSHHTKNKKTKIIFNSCVILFQGRLQNTCSSPFLLLNILHKGLGLYSSIAVLNVCHSEQISSDLA